LPFLAYQLSHTGAPFTLRPTLLIVRSDLMKLLGGPHAVLALGLGSGVAFMTMLRRPWSLRAVAVLAGTAIVVVAVGSGWALSRQNSVWVYRYLAIVVGPMALVLAAGLAEGGRAATAALAMAVVFSAPIAVKGQPYEKSNVRDVTTKLGPMLGAGDLVIADFGRVPVLAHYLPPGLRYAETTGPVTDPRTSDQRDATRRLAEGRPAVTLREPIEEVTAGGRVLVVCSAGELPLDATPFLRLIFERCQEALAMLKNPSFRVDAIVAAPPYGSNNPVNGYLFTRVEAPAAS
jgi:pimeloyl-ACP methyl ester carboxylesterase